MLFIGALLLHVQGGSPDPRRVILQATRAIEGDSATRVRTQWTARVARDSTDWATRLGLATLARLSYDYPTSDSLYAGLVRSSAPGAAPYAAYARLELGKSLYTRAMIPQADTAYRLAADAARHQANRGLEASALVALAGLRARTGGAAAADSLLRRAGGLMSDDDLLSQSEYHCGRAALLQMRGQPDAVSEARIGADLAQRAGSLRQHAICQRIVAVGLMEDGENGRALFRTVVDELTTARDRAALASTLQWRGYHYILLYHFGLARADLLRAVEEGKASGASSPVAWALLNLAQLSAWAGDATSAREYGDSAETIFEALRDQWGLVSLASVQGVVAILAGDKTRARASYQRALAAGEAMGVPTIIVPARKALASLDMDDGHLDDAERNLRLASKAAHESGQGSEERGLWYDFGRLALLRGQLDLAAREFHRDVPNLAAQPAAAYKHHARLAEVLVRQGRADEAERELRRASDALDAQRAGLGDVALRTLVLQSQRDLVDADLGIPRVLAGLVAAGRTPAAFELAERHKARSLLEQLVLRHALGEQGDTALADLASRIPAGVTLASVAAALPDDRTALLEYVTGHEGAPTTLFVVTRAGTRALRLLAFDSLAGDARRFTTLIEAGENPRDLARALGDAILSPALADLPASVDRLVIVPDAGLQRLPFDALTLPDGHAVVERFAVSFAPSAAVAGRLWRLPPAVGPVSVLAFGDPQFAREVPPGTTSEVYREAFSASGGLTRLAASAAEARMVAAYAPRGVLRLRGDASEAYLKRTPLRGYRVLHFAAHAVVDEEAPTRTALALAPGGGEDGFVTPSDLAALDLDADLVVLSACRTAGGVFVRGEGVEGLTAPLLEAGARGVVASLWQVGDRNTAAFVEAFYKELAGGATTGDALTAAKRGALRRGQLPASWAAFTLVGDPTVRIPLRAPASRWWALATLAALALAAAYGLMVRGRRAERV